MRKSREKKQREGCEKNIVLIHGLLNLCVISRQCVITILLQDIICMCAFIHDLILISFFRFS